MVSNAGFGGSLPDIVDQPPTLFVDGFEQG
jgi:hypothetical protein